MSRKTSISSMIMPVAFPLVVLVMLVLLVIFVAVLQFKSGRDYPVKINVSFLMRDAGEMDANTGCLPTSIKSLNDRFYQMKPESNTCNKKFRHHLQRCMRHQPMFHLTLKDLCLTVPRPYW